MLKDFVRLASAREALRRTLEFALVVLFVIVSSFLIYAYYNQLAGFFLEGNPAYRGIAIFSLCFVGACSIFFPIPYTATILSLTATIPGVNLTEIAIWGGLGSGIGELMGWVVGRYLRHQVEGSRYGKKLAIVSRLASNAKSRWVIPFLVFLFALTPLPDDIIFIVLGAVNYNLLVATTSSVIGKIAMLYTIGFLGSSIGGATSAMPDWIPVLMSAVLFLAFLAAIEFVDWESLLSRYAKPTEGGEPVVKVSPAASAVAAIVAEEQSDPSRWESQPLQRGTCPAIARTAGRKSCRRLALAFPPMTSSPRSGP